MKFVFEARASDYDLAAEQEILLRHVSKRKRNWTVAVGLSVLTAVMATVLIVADFGDRDKTLQIAGMVIGVILVEQWYLDYTSGNPKAYLKMLYRGRTTQTAADLEKPIRVEITEGENAIEIFNENGKAGEWDFTKLVRVTESDRVYELVRGGMPKQYLALPKSALVEGTQDELRRCLREKLGGKPIEHFDISERRQKQLMTAKYKLFKQ